mmetsp:Transcript_98485/g.287280  ORF Transcript_98485/g.287280 Transcript_98485/m.287280 type:complete len:258 (-) Transcript_98485:2671-3444(-)
MAEAKTLAFTLGASTPVLPLAERAVHRLGAFAHRAAALPRFPQRAAARLAAVGGRDGDLAHAGVLPATASDGASIPCRPVAKLAVNRRLRVHLAWAGPLAWHWVARRDLFQVPLAEGALARSVPLNAARTPHNSVARLRASTPDTPVAEHAVDIWLARDVGIANSGLPGITFQGLAARARRARHLPRAPGRAAAAGGGAPGPGGPVRPEAVLASRLVARVRVAGSNLGFVQNLAHLAPLRGHLRDVPVTALLAAIAG